MREKLLERFLRYVQIFSESSHESAENGNLPSTPQQFDFAKIVAEDLQQIGLEAVQVTSDCYVYGYLPASTSCAHIDSVCFLAHLDTVEEVSGLNVKPQVHNNYDGKKITLGHGYVLDPEIDKDLAAAGSAKETVITTDGTTLLGGDDKAGVAAIVTALEYLVGHPEIPHGKIEVIFSPDEETGHGMDKVPLELLESKYAYTVDGGHIGELETECFNAVGSKVVFKGKSVHTGTARAGGMVNAIIMAAKFVECLPHKELPETTDGYEGFFAPMEINGSVEEAVVYVLLRDFSADGLERRKKIVDNMANVIAETNGGSVQIEHKEQYKNMREKISDKPFITDNLVVAYKAAGVEPNFVPIRGGTDGSRLTEMGIPTPNIFTGTHNMHSRYEWVSLEQMQKASEIVVNVAKIIASAK